MAKNSKTDLVIVESPAKARTLSKILGPEYTIKASLGHIRDLPKSSLGIDIEDNFKPKYTLLKEKKKVIYELKKSAEQAKSVYLATDPDREGEAISWHLIQAIKLNEKHIPIHRVSFHEITPEAVKQAFKTPRSIDMDLVDAQQARRLLDRIVGYKLSPLLWKKVLRGLSAGRVQSAAVRIIVDREQEIRNFIPVEFWTIEAELAKDEVTPKGPSFRALFIGLADGKKVTISNADEAKKLEGELRKSAYSVRNIQTKQIARKPSAPFTTSTMQQEAWWRLRFSASRTMAIAQQLYEGIAIGDEGSVGLITYMRTDSTYVTPSAIHETREYIENKYSLNYLPSKQRQFTKKNKFSQEAHEAIRPTKVFRDPDDIKQYLKPEQYKLYQLIWKRMVASQMADAIFDSTEVDVDAKNKQTLNNYLLKASTSKLKFPGFMVLYAANKDENGKDSSTTKLPELVKGEKLTLIDIYSKKNFTEPPSRYNEATLIKALEQKGIGRPSTYAPIISTIQDREYVLKEGGKFKPGDIGEIVDDILVKNFPNIVDLDFTARIEGDLDKIASGDKKWILLLKDFYKPFNDSLEKATNTLQRVKTDKETDIVCPECGRKMVIKTGRFGKFLACSGYPECKKTMPLLIKIGVPCPECGSSQGGELVQRKSKKKRIFYGCSRYPECRFVIKQRPLPQPCPTCGKLLIYYRKNLVKCTACNYRSAVHSSENSSNGDESE